MNNKQLNKVNRVEVIDHTLDIDNGGGRAYVKWENDIEVSVDLQDNNKTLKIFIKPREDKMQSTKKEKCKCMYHGIRHMPFTSCCKQCACEIPVCSIKNHKHPNKPLESETFKLKIDEWEIEFRKKFIHLFQEYHDREVPGSFSEGENLEVFIKSNFISKKELRKVLQQGHGGGNFRRLIMQLLD